MSQNHSKNLFGGKSRSIGYRWAFTSVMGVILSYAFVFLAALPIRYLRLIYGRRVFVFTSFVCMGTLLAFGLWQWALVYFSLCFLIGVYRELEEKNFSIFLASTVTVLVTAGTNLFAVFGYTRWTGQNMKVLLTEKAQPIYTQLKDMPRFKEMDLTELVWFIPSGLIITLMVILFVSLTVTKLPSSPKKQTQMRMFKLPDWAIWTFIVSLAATFIDLGSVFTTLVGSNILAISMAAYFFQGLAVFTNFLDRLSIFGFWRLLAYFLVFFQMFIFVSGLGILDYWFDFRFRDNKNNKHVKES